MQKQENRGRNKTPEYHAGDGNLPLINSFLDRAVIVEVGDREVVTGVLLAYLIPRGNAAFKLVVRLSDSRIVIVRNWLVVKRSHNLSGKTIWSFPWIYEQNKIGIEKV